MLNVKKKLQKVLLFLLVLTVGKQYLKNLFHDFFLMLLVFLKNKNRPAVCENS